MLIIFFFFLGIFLVGAIAKPLIDPFLKGLPELFIIFIFSVGIFVIGTIGKFSIENVLQRFPEKFNQFLKRIKTNGYNDRQPHRDIDKIRYPLIKEAYSFIYVTENAWYLLFIILFTSILEAIIIAISESYIKEFLFVVLFAFYMVLRLPLLIEFFVRGNFYREMEPNLRKSDRFYKIYVFRIRPSWYGAAIIPLLIALIF